jgi:parallel beta-helix repeat protein
VSVRDGTITLRQCEITYNVAYADSPDTARGGGLALCGVYGAEGNALIEATNIMSNTAAPDSTLHGGGLYLAEYSQVTFQGSENLIAYNEATAGGGVYMYGNVDLEGVRILENHASSNGGGIFLASSYDGARIANNHLIRNSAGVTAPSIIAADSSVEIANNTIVGDSLGEGIYVGNFANGMLELTNNIVTGHAIGIAGGTGVSVTLSNNDVWGNTTNYDGVSAGSGDISADPEFVDPDNDDYHLTADSPCVNAGEYIDWLLFDYEGDRRTGSLLDIGADEYGSDYLVFVPAALKGYAP